MADTSDTVLTLVGYLLAFVLGFGAAVVRERGETRRSREAQQAERVAAAGERRAAAEDRSRELQRETLYELQDVLPRVMRLDALAYWHDKEVYRKGGSRQLPEEIGGDPALEVQRRAAILVSRVTDSEMRRLYEQLGEESALLVTARDEETSDIAMDRTVEAYNVLILRVGEILRGL